MVGRLTRFGALAMLVFLLAGLAHVWVESSPAQVSGHRCQFCLSGGWAIVSSGAGLDMTLRILDRKSTRLNSSHIQKSRMPSSA